MEVGSHTARFRGLLLASGASVLAHRAYFTIQIFWKMRETMVISFMVWNRWLCLSPHRCHFNLSREGLSRIGYNRRRSCSRNWVSHSSYCAVASINFGQWIPPLPYLAPAFPAGSCLILGVTCLLSESNERNEIAGVSASWSSCD